MSELPPDLPRLRAIARWLELTQARVRKAIAEAEVRAAEEAARPRWWVQWMRTPRGEPRRGILHREGCWCPGSPNLRAAQVRELLAEHGPRIERCLVCGAEAPKS
ncbi:hypothetical protein [Streptomyces hoynatensis]|nr:hypothetical protein [Streptomyces hoynatensis]